jgi:hypothetical protein
MQPQYAYQTAPMNMMPTYKKGGDVEQTYGLRNAAEQLRERGRNGDTILAHINPQEAGILKLLGGSGTINPYTGLPEYGWFKDTFGFSTPKVIKSVGDELYRTGSRIGKGIESGIESIAKALGPVGQIAAAYFGGPIGAAIYAGLAPEGSSFDVKGAVKAAALTYAGQQLSQGLGQAGTPMGDAGGIGAEGASMSNLPYGAGDLVNQQFIDNAAGFVGDPTYYPSVEAAVSSAGNAPLAYDGSGIGAPMDQYASAASTATDAYPAPPPPPTPSVDPYAVDNVGNVSEGRVMGDGYGRAPVEDYSRPLTDYSGVRGLDPAGENYLGAAGSLAEGAYDLATSLPVRAVDAFLNASPLTQASIAYGGYTAYQTKKELDAAKDEADRILRDQANKKKEEIEWAQSVLRDYPFNYERLTAEEVRRERGMASGGIASFDDEVGGDDGMMQGGIAALAKGGLPPRYLRGGGDGMSDSIRARIDGKQEARLADGEFVVPADVVSHLGNGSSNAGAKKLYAMMDRVRNARTGKKRQAPQVKTERYLPA